LIKVGSNYKSLSFLEDETFVVDHGLQGFFLELEVVPLPVEGLVGERLLIGVVVALEVGVTDAVFHGGPYYINVLYKIF
jgi:hypothetical protein